MKIIHKIRRKSDHYYLNLNEMDRLDIRLQRCYTIINYCCSVLHSQNIILMHINLDSPWNIYRARIVIHMWS
ncbi:hypothetical protein GCM10011391_18790 [Pullulanibacillus camelliae]|uniref:Uncharacterized protein n=1 Tax=Pullulanibacillus camelliae TaxID=1707096 RepID=A0A8J2YH35_9BACL|nr:hypothetical protein GCM10011391_18790 [Pullulanibacillus camelliae]